MIELIADPVAVVIPSYNEADCILKLVQTLLDNRFIELITVVDDSPNVDTINQLVSVSDNPRVRVIHRKQKGGRGSAVMDGIKFIINHCSPAYIIEMDADFSHQPQEIPGLINKIAKSNAGLVVASRYLPESRILNWPLRRRLFSKYANWLAKTLLRIPISDYTNGFRIYTLEAATFLTQQPLLGTGFIALSDVLVRIYYQGWRVMEVPSTFRNRVRGESAVNMKEIINAFFGIFKVHAYANKLKQRAKI